MKLSLLFSLLALLPLVASLAIAEELSFRAGASVVDVSPPKLPSIRNGGFLEAVWNRTADPLYARSLVFDDGKETIVLCVVDSCMLPTDTCDAIKELVTEGTGIARERILVSATHTHSAPSAMGMCLGTRRDEDYTAFLIPKVAEGIVAAWKKRSPARVGWTSVEAPEFTNCRRWIFRSDKVGTDPFGARNVRAMMHPGYENPTTTGPAGPIDPELFLLSVVGDGGEPIAALANYSMHYFGSGAAFSADYFGEVAHRIESALGGGAVGIVSQGTSGDLHWMDYSRPKRVDLDRGKYSEGLAAVAIEALKQIEHRDGIDLAMSEKRLPLLRRMPSKERLAWAKVLNEQRLSRPAEKQRPKDRPEVYAEQAQWISENPETDVVLQAVRIGELLIAALPNEVYGITGLKLKALSPLEATFNIELANGAEGYIPPPEQHALGGYTTWPARTAGLEVEAEPKIVATLLELFEEVSGKPALPRISIPGPYGKTVLAQGPVAFWRCNDMSGPHAGGATTDSPPARFEPGVAFYLPGVQRKGGAISTPPEAPSPFSGDRENRAVHFAGGRLVSKLSQPQREYSVSFWFWNGFPKDVRPVTGYLFSRGENGDRQALGEHLGIGGTVNDTRNGCLFFYTGNEVGEVVNGSTPLAFRDWHHVVVVRNGDSLRVYLDGKPEIEAEVAWTIPESVSSFFLGGRCDNFANFEGKLDEIAVFAKPLTEAQVAAQFAAAERTPPIPPKRETESEPLDPDKALETLRVPDGYTIDLVAAEPLVLDPVAFDWDTKGRLWVVEMADYPLGLDEEGSAGGRIRVLEDRDRDGTYDESSLFAEGLNFPNGILTWRDGIIVTAAPDILYLEDRNGDGKADESEREVLLTGLTEGNQQLRANGLRWGLDNWVYVAAGGHHGKYGVDTMIRSTRTGTDTKIGSRDFRFRPDTGEVEPQSGPSQFGRNRDDWGQWFGTQNSRPLWHYVLPDHYLRRNPHYAPPEGRVLLPNEVNPPIYPAKPPQKRFHGFDQSGRFTSACSGMIYRDDDLFPRSAESRFGWDGADAFSCEPFHNLVQRIGLKRANGTFTAERKGEEGEPDFFSGTDRWFRPVMARTGPDGGLWVADMYRYMIEHPQWLPEEGKQELLPHYREGDDRGRVYRIRRSGPDAKPVPILKENDLVSQLESSNGWVRDKAHQALLWKGDPSAVPSIRELARTSEDPRVRVQALSVLEGLDALEKEEVRLALRSEHPGVRSHALRLSETKLPASLEEEILKLADDPDPAVRLQCAFTMGEIPPSAAAAAVLTDWLQSPDPFLAAAASSSLLPHFEPLVAACPDDASPAYREQLAATALALKNKEAFRTLVRPVLDRIPDTLTLLDRLAMRNLSAEVLEKDEALSGAFATLVKEARTRIEREGDSVSDCLDAAALLARIPSTRESGIDYLANRISSTAPPSEFQQALGALGRSGGKQVPEILLGTWSSLSPVARNQVAGVLLSRGDWTNSFLDAVEQTQVRPGEIDPAVKTRLQKHPNRTTRTRATTLFADSKTGRRADVVAAYGSSLEKAGDVARGETVFQKACLACHKRGDLGASDVGPDLATVTDHPPEKLLANILDPNLDIQPGYHAYHCELRSGEQLFGLIAGESASGITLKQLDGTNRNLLRNEIVSLKSADVSLMPEGLEASITIEEMADLIAFLKAR